MQLMSDFAVQHAPVPSTSSHHHGDDVAWTETRRSLNPQLLGELAAAVGAGAAGAVV